jgi:predicted TIM-barrel fold metal-dependent hydrolase
MGAIDYWCNAFDPAREGLWKATIEEQGIPIKIRSGDDGFAEAGTMLARMDELDLDALLLPSVDPPAGNNLRDYEHFATPFEDVVKLAADFPGRFAGLWSFDPSLGMEGVRRAAEALASEACVGLHLHTHSWDRAFDDRSLYPFYALAADCGVPVVVQAGSSGGLMPSECGKPIGIDRPALYFEDVPFVLSHTGWPWVDEAVAMSMKHPNVFIGTAAYPPHHWPDALVGFIRGPGRGKTLWGTSFPTVGHRQSLARLEELSLDDETRYALLEGVARSIFRRLAARSTDPA